MRVEGGRSAGRRWLLVVVGIGVALAVAGVLAVVLRSPADSQYSGSTGDPRVLVVGDSITVLSRSSIRAALGSSLRLRIEAVNGQRTDQMVPHLQAGLADPAGAPAAVIINLGTNDGLEGRSDTVRQYRRLVRIVDDVPCVVLTTVSSLADRPHGEGAPDLNALIARLARLDPRFVVADWRGTAAAQPALVNSTDRVHPTKAGELVLAGLYLDALHSCPKPLS